MLIRRKDAQTAETIDEVQWPAQELDIAEKPNGPGAAAIIAAGAGAAALGVLTVLNEASEKLHDFLALDDGVGPLAGKTVFAVVAYAIAWAVLAAAMWRRNVRMRTVLAVTAVLLIIGFVGTFPKFFEQFASD